MKSRTASRQDRNLPQTPEDRGRKRTGRLYFSRRTEQTIFFYLTMAMLLAGLVCRLM